MGHVLFKKRKRENLDLLLTIYIYIKNKGKAKHFVLVNFSQLDNRYISQLLCSNEDPYCFVL